MKVKLVFEDWRKDNRSIYNTEKGIDLGSGPFHAGTTFDGEIKLDEFDEQELRSAIQDGYEPIFCVISDKS